MGSYAHKLMLRALPLHQAGRLVDAEPIYRQVLAQEPNHADALHLLGVLLHQSCRTAEGLDLILRAIRLRPATPDYRVNAGELLRTLGRFEESLVQFESAVRLNPNIPELHNNLATLHLALNRLDAAEASLARAIRLRPAFSEAFVNLGNVADRRGQSQAAVAHYQRALEVNPDNAEALASLGNVLGKLGRTSEALAVLTRSIQINPRISKSHNNLANNLQSRGLLDESIASYRAALAIDPANATAHSNLLFALNRDPRPSPAEIFQAHADFARHQTSYISPLLSFPVVHLPSRPLRIAYVSPDFRKHSVAYFLEPILARHDRSRFHVSCYSNTAVTDSTTARLQTLVDAWHDITRLTDAEAASLIRSHAVDILIDLAGHTEGNRLLTFARRPAPLQMTYLGYPNTTGLSSIDYRLTDPLADPPGQTDAFHSERLLRLPRTAWCYQPPSDAPPVRPVSDRPLTFGSFNNFAKVSPWLIRLWARLLHAVPGSRLLIKTRSLDDEGTRQHCQALFAASGIALDRISLRPWDPSAVSHLSTYDEVDIALDTYPYHGTTTTCEAILMGVPVVTLAGQTHVSRVGVSLLTNVGLADLIASTPDEYVRIAAELAADAGRRADLRSTLRQRLVASPLCDAAAFIRDLECAYCDAWAERCKA